MFYRRYGFHVCDICIDIFAAIPSDDWKAFQSVSEDYMEIGSRWRNSTFYKYPRTNFWNVYKPKLLNFTTPSEGVPCNDVSAASTPLSRYHILIAALLFICTQTMNAFSLWSEYICSSLWNRDKQLKVRLLEQNAKHHRFEKLHWRIWSRKTLLWNYDGD